MLNNQYIEQKEGYWKFNEAQIIIEEIIKA